MDPLPLPEVYGGLVLLFVALLPLGASILRLAEMFRGRRFSLSTPERLVLAFYVSGGFLFLLASVPASVFSGPVVLGCIAGGWVVYTAFAWRERGTGLVASVGWCRREYGLLAIAGSAGLLYLQVSAGLVSLPNGIDGAMDSLYTTVLLAHHSIPWTFEPYANSGIIYPQGVSVWMSLPVLLFGWPVVSEPVVLPPLFLSLTIAAAFGLGIRLHPLRNARPEFSGLVFAAFFGLVASWPRLYVAGSYDFIFALPLFLLSFGLLWDFWRTASPAARDLVLLGGLVGITTALSATVGLAMILLSLVYLLRASRRRGARRLREVLPRFLVVPALASLFVLRSFIGLGMWYGYPGHVLNPTGNPPYAPPGPTAYGGWMGQLDPFVPWKGKVSPIPVMALEIQLLLAAGLILTGLFLVRAAPRLASGVPKEFVELAGLATVSLFAVTLTLVILDAIGPSNGVVPSVTNLWEMSILLFTAFELVALLPILVALNFLSAQGSAFALAPSTDHRPASRGQGRPAGGWKLVVTCAVVVALPIASGAVATVVVVPGYLNSAILLQANVTQGDIDALEWAGAHLPSCSNVVVAPGSAASFLPEYVQTGLLYPVLPPPSNLSYYVIVTNLTDGVYTNQTRAALEQLLVTEVFVTGQTTNAREPFQAGPLRNSSDFRALFSEQDAAVFEFVPGVLASGCAPR